jgi:hypothetical protein
MRFIPTGVLIVMFAALAGCTGKDDRKGPGADAKADFSMSCEELGGEHDRHPKETDQKYLGKTIELTGRFHLVETRTNKSVPEENGLFVMMSHTTNCRFPDSEKAALSKLKEGDVITVVGVYRVVEAKNYMYLDNCRLRPTAK